MRTVVTVVALGLLLGGCASSTDDKGIASAGSSGSSAPQTSVAVSGDTDEQTRKFAKCMRDNGVDMPDPEPGGGFGDKQIDRTSPAFQKAMDACKSLLPGGGDLSKIDPKLVDELREFTKCMRDNGVDIPDPDPNSPMLGLDKIAGLDRESPVFKKAMEACKDKVPGRFGR
ncbi:hypothetical protein [Kibdelosporangium phytohabitans]|uniref:Lipoprotein n=1 Tax=Kibdelosporangium phytohabitans TaxID=860235 RepID=A0A0N9IE10_9PSEU|nr:hypothetical protein [Kibdelosporangium phytohabitans]ALG13003.1 hypothetical protein AOZ06_44595 [Kibdelosporangium phytohabitans]MBE1464725.1 hypothetical protein [Kibdelosporangium phytohabitans]